MPSSILSQEYHFQRALWNCFDYCDFSRLASHRLLIRLDSIIRNDLGNNSAETGLNKSIDFVENSLSLKYSTKERKEFDIENILMQGVFFLLFAGVWENQSK